MLLQRRHRSPRGEYVRRVYRARPWLEPLETRVVPSATGLSPVRPNALAQIGAAQAQARTAGDMNVVVGHVDTGIDYTHRDLYLNVWLNQGELAGRRAGLADADSDNRITFRDLNAEANQGALADVDDDGRITGRDVLAQWSDGVDDDANGYVDDLIGWDFLHNDNNPFDTNGHGTLTAGVLGGADSGVAGSVSIMALQISDGRRGTTGLAARALYYAIDNGARLSNHSYVASGHDGDVLSRAIAFAGQKNHLVVAAAGNSGQDNDTSHRFSYPASYDLDNIVAVTATDADDNLADFASYGDESVDLAAPGVNIVSTLPTRLDPDGHARASGTSLAAPQVTGTAALLLSLDRTLTADELKKILLDTAEASPDLEGRTVSGARLDAAAAVDAVADALPTPDPDAGEPVERPDARGRGRRVRLAQENDDSGTDPSAAPDRGQADLILLPPVSLGGTLRAAFLVPEAPGLEVRENRLVQPLPPIPASRFLPEPLLATASTTTRQLAPGLVPATRFVGSAVDFPSDEPKPAEKPEAPPPEGGKPERPRPPMMREGGPEMGPTVPQAETMPMPMPMPPPDPGMVGALLNLLPGLQEEEEAFDSAHTPAALAMAMALVGWRELAPKDQASRRAYPGLPGRRG